MPPAHPTGQALYSHLQPRSVRPSPGLHRPGAPVWLLWRGPGKYIQSQGAVHYRRPLPPRLPAAGHKLPARGHVYACLCGAGPCRRNTTAPGGYTSPAGLLPSRPSANLRLCAGPRLLNRARAGEQVNPREGAARVWPIYWCTRVAPYVEQSAEGTIKNIDWAIRTALKHGLHLDFHLDYNLDGSAEFLMEPVIRLLGDHQWSRRAEKSKSIVIGHCSHLTTLPAQKILHMANNIRQQSLPVHFVGLPTSDLFMMGRPSEMDATPHNRP